MDRFAQYAFSVTARDASFAGVAAVTLMVGFSFNPPLALVIGAHIALIFSVALLYRVTILTEERLRRTEIWRGLEPIERPNGDLALTRARDGLEEILLRFSKSSAALSCTLFILAIGMSLTCGEDGCLYTGM